MHLVWQITICSTRNATPARKSLKFLLLLQMEGIISVFFVLDYTSGFIFTTAKVVLITAKIASIFPVHTSLVSL